MSKKSKRKKRWKRLQAMYTALLQARPVLDSLADFDVSKYRAKAVWLGDQSQEEPPPPESTAQMDIPA